MGSRFCDTCGALLDVAPAAVPPDLVTEYTSGSFSDFFADDAAGGAGGAPTTPEATAADRAAADRTAADRAAAGEAAAGSAAAGALAAAIHAQRGRRWRSVGAGLAVLVAAVIAGEFTLLQHRAGHQPQATPTPRGIVPAASASMVPSAAPAPSASASPTTSPTAAPAAAPAQQAVPATATQPPDQGSLPARRRGFLEPGHVPVHFVLPGPPFVPHGLSAAQEQAVLRIVLSFPGLPHGGGFHHR